MRQKAVHDRRAKPRSFVFGDTVFVRNYFKTKRWLPGSIIAIRHPLSYEVTLEGNRVFRRHIDQIRQ